MYLIHILGIFTIITQFPGIKTHNALEVMIDNIPITNPLISILRDDVTVKKKIKLEEYQNFFYLCPPESAAQERLVQKLGYNCLFAKEISKKRISVSCNNEVIPDVKETSVKCGHQYNEGILYHVSLTICFEMVYAFLENTDGISEQLKKDGNKMKKDYISSPTLTIIPYTFCFNHQTSQTLFVRYDISSLKSIVEPIPSKFQETFPTLTTDPFNLKTASQCYKQENQNQAINFMYSDEPPKPYDHLVEQMLVPWGHVPLKLLGKTTENYINIRPQWGSIHQDWQKLSDAIKQKSKMIWRKSFGPEKKIHKGFLMYSGTFGEWEEVDDQSRKIIRIGSTKQDEKSELTEFLLPAVETKMTEPLLKQESTSKEFSKNSNTDDQSNEKKPLNTTVPVFWWMLITMYHKREGMVLLMPNYPKNKQTNTNLSPCLSICNTTEGWDFVEDINPNIICCQPTDELLSKLSNLVKIENESVLYLDQDLPDETQESLRKNVFVTLQNSY